MASNAGRWHWAEELPSDELGFAPYNVMGVFPSLITAEEAAQDLRIEGLAEREISIRTRTITDDPAAPRVAAAVEAPTRQRDAQVAGRIFTRVVVLAAAVAGAAALVGFLIALAIGMSAPTIVIVTVVAAVAGSVVGAVWGGVIGSMTEAQKEEGVVVWARCEDRASAIRAVKAIRGRQPLRMDTYDGQGRPVRLG